MSRTSGKEMSELIAARNRLQEAVDSMSVELRDTKEALQECEKEKDGLTIELHREKQTKESLWKRFKDLELEAKKQKQANERMRQDAQIASTSRDTKLNKVKILEHEVQTLRLDNSNMNAERNKLALEVQQLQAELLSERSKRLEDIHTQDALTNAKADMEQREAAAEHSALQANTNVFEKLAEIEGLQAAVVSNKRIIKAQSGELIALQSQLSMTRKELARVQAYVRSREEQANKKAAENMRLEKVIWKLKRELAENANSQTDLARVFGSTRRKRTTGGSRRSTAVSRTTSDSNHNSTFGSDDLSFVVDQHQEASAEANAHGFGSALYSGARQGFGVGQDVFVSSVSEHPAYSATMQNSGDPLHMSRRADREAGRGLTTLQPTRSAAAMGALPNVSHVSAITAATGTPVTGSRGMRRGGSAADMTMSMILPAADGAQAGVSASASSGLFRHPHFMNQDGHGDPHQRQQSGEGHEQPSFSRDTHSSSRRTRETDEMLHPPASSAANRSLGLTEAQLHELDKSTMRTRLRPHNGSEVDSMSTASLLERDQEAINRLVNTKGSTFLGVGLGREKDSAVLQPTSEAKKALHRILTGQFSDTTLQQQQQQQQQRQPPQPDTRARSSIHRE